MKDPFDLSSHVAVVTGGNSGIGLGFAEGLARAGAAVCIWGRDEAKNAAAREQLRVHGNPVLALTCDVGDESQVIASMCRAVEVLGPIGSCFVNAGVMGATKPFVETTLDDFRDVTRINLDAAFVTFREATRHLLAQGTGGSLVATSSIVSRYGLPRGQAYATTKAGLIALTNSIAVELAPQGIRANCVLPGWVETPMTDPLLHWDRFADNVLPRIPVKRWGQPTDFEAIAVYLASSASAFHTGDAIVIDGGYSVY